MISVTVAQQLLDLEIDMIVVATSRVELRAATSASAFTGG
jgi:hypothetical protein